MTAWTDNPLVQQVAQRGRWPSLRTVIWFAFGLGLAMTAILTIAIRHMPITGALVVWPSVFGWLVTLFAPPVIGMVSGVSTVRTVSSEAFELVRLTNLSAQEIIRGLVGRVFYRMRVLLGLIVAALPVIVLSTIYLALGISVVFYSIYCPTPLMSGSAAYPCDYLPTFGPPAAWLSLVVIALGLWGMAVLAAALGTALGLNIKKGGAAGAITLVLILPLTLGGALLMAFAVGLLIETSNWLFGGLPLNWDIFLSMMILLVMTALLYALAAGLMRLSRRWVK
jgi:hypothetical protein